MQPKRLSILGVGLLGGSIGLAIRSITSTCKIIGYGHRRESLEQARQFGAIDEIALTPAAAVDGADLVVLCTPVGIFARLMKEISPALATGAIVTDVGSTKRSIVQAAEKLPPRVRFVASHPMAGSEKRSVEFARADLFRNACCITTPTNRTDPAALTAVEEFWKSLGMRIVRLSPEDHDRHLAAISHLPHAVAAALVAMQNPAALELAGKGFIDTTRIAGGDGALWRDIFLDNRDNLAASIQSLEQNLQQLKLWLAAGDGESIRAWLDDATRRRQRLLEQKLSEVSPD
jgi:prephenate dehydrogenase